MTEESVKVAVRVRPFNDREKQLGCKCVVSMSGNQTILENLEKPGSEPYRFTFDYSYWSHDKSAEFADQARVFQDLGVGVLNNAWAGYNCSLFAYGQTGSGKSYSMVGYGADKGIVPMACEELFNRIGQNQNADVSYSVEASMIEIYSEKVRDLFNPKNPGNSAGLNVRENPQTGPYIEGLSRSVVKSYNEIQKLMDEGIAARTVACTNMNKTSSRAHTLFDIIFTQSTKVGTKVSSKRSKITLVDLAGSERVEKTGAKGDTLKEGIAINTSLTSLGNCIEALATKASAKNKKAVFIPYRNSVLTWIMKNSLGGNAKTIMIAAISPASDNFDETLSTLRYANRAKQIKNNVVVNEDPQDKLIKDLRAQIQALQEQLTKGGITPRSGSVDVAEGSVDNQAMDQLKTELEQSQTLIKQLEMTIEEKEKLTAQISESRHAVLEAAGLVQTITPSAFNRKQDPHFVNLNEDPQMSEMLVYPLLNPRMLVGRTEEAVKSGISISGLGIEDEHCLVEVDKSQQPNVVYLTPVKGEAYINGKKCEAKTALQAGDRVIFGMHHVFKFVNGKSTNQQAFDYQAAVKEMAESIAEARASKIKEEAQKAEQELLSQIQAIETQKKQQEQELIAEKEKMTAKEKEIVEKQTQMNEAITKMEADFKQQQEKLIKEIQEREIQVKAEMSKKDEMQRRQMQAQLDQEKEEAKKKLQTIQDEMHQKESEMKHQVSEMIKQNRQLQEHSAALETTKLTLQHQQQELEKKLKEQMELVEQHNLMKAEQQKKNAALAAIVRQINEANVMSNRLDKNVDFELKMVVVADSLSYKILVRDENTDWEALWDVATFEERVSRMKDIYAEYENCRATGVPFEYSKFVTSATSDPFFDVEAAARFSVTYGQLSKKQLELNAKLAEIELAEQEKHQKNLAQERLKMQEKEEALNQELDAIRQEMESKQRLFADQMKLTEEVINSLKGQETQKVKELESKLNQAYEQIKQVGDSHQKTLQERESALTHRLQQMKLEMDLISKEVENQQKLKYEKQMEEIRIQNKQREEKLEKELKDLKNTMTSRAFELSSSVSSAQAMLQVEQTSEVKDEQKVKSLEDQLSKAKQEEERVKAMFEKIVADKEKELMRILQEDEIEDKKREDALKEEINALKTKVKVLTEINNELQVQRQTDAREKQKLAVENQQLKAQVTKLSQALNNVTEEDAQNHFMMQLFRQKIGKLKAKKLSKKLFSSKKTKKEDSSDSSDSSDDEMTMFV